MGCNSSKRVQNEPKEDITEHQLSVSDVESKEWKSWTDNPATES